VTSAGLLRDGEPASAHGVRTLAERGIDIEQHRSRQITADMVADADLVLTMERRHLREAVVLMPSSFPTAFTLKELARRVGVIGPRRANETVEVWLHRASAGRRPADLMGEAPDDEVEDPIGRSKREYEKTADEIDALLGAVVAAMFPAASPSITDPH
jgi:protein-tyrosine phosphatase